MIPAFPPDATIFSIHLAWLRVGRSSGLYKSSTDFYGTRVAFQNRFGYMAKKFVDRALAGTIQTDELIKRHSMFSFMAAFLTYDAAHRWSEALASGHPDAYRRFSVISQNVSRSTQGLRQCKACVSEDEERYGTGHWHVIHQMPLIHTCPIHQQVLHDTCAGCGATFGDQAGWTLPGAPCVRCGHSQTKPIAYLEDSEGYRALSALIVRALNGQARELGPDARTFFLKSFIARSKSYPRDRLDQFLEYWNVSNICELNKILQCQVQYWDAHKLFSDGCAKVSVFFLSAVLAYVWEKTLECDRQVLFQQIGSEQKLLEGILKVEPPSQDSLCAEIEVIARRFHLPNGVVKHLTDGNKAQAVQLVGGIYVFLIMDGLTQKSREQLNDRVYQYEQGRQLFKFAKANPLKFNNLPKKHQS